MACPRSFAEKLLHEFQRLAREDRSPGTFLDLAEQIIHEAIAYELDWLADYLTERAKRMAPQRGEAGGTGPVKPAPRLVVPSGQLPP
jgi:hypothetical protein